MPEKMDSLRNYKPIRSTVVTCPKCGGPTKGEKKTRKCTNPTCPFRHGYHLEPFKQIGLEPLQGDTTVYAVPLTKDGMPDKAQAVLWPRLDDSRLPKDPEAKPTAA